MLHELLLALSGHPGDVFVPSPPEAPTTYAVAEDFPFLHPAERTALNRLATLGFQYAYIRDYVDEQKKQVWGATLGNRASNPTAAPNTGFYRLALCSGLDEVLDEYTAAIVKTERKVLSQLDLDTDGGKTPVSYLTAAFGKYQILLPHIVKLVETMRNDPSAYHGARVLNLLHKRCYSGLTEVRRAMISLFKVCMAVFYKQLVSWMLYGILHDPHREFFVTSGHPSGQMVGASCSSGGMKANAPTRSQHQNWAEDGFDVQLDAEHTQWQSRYKLDHTLTLDFVPVKLAEAILFVGKALVTIKQSSQLEAMDAASTLVEHADSFSALADDAEFQPLPFEIAIGKVKKEVAAILWDVVVMDEHLTRHLHAIKNTYELGFGDLWMAFIEECSKLKANAVTRLSRVTEHELNSTFRSLLRQRGGADVDLYSTHFRFKVVLDRTGKTVLRASLPSIAESSHTKHILEDEPDGGLSAIHVESFLGLEVKLDYVVKWPLDLIFVQEDITRYNIVFAFLLQLKSTHMRVQRVCSSISQSVRGADRVARSGQDRSDSRSLDLPREIWRLRAMMLFFLDCLWSYIQMDVLESNHQILLQRVTRKQQVEHDDPPPDSDDAQPTARPSTSSRPTAIGGLVGHAEPTSQPSSPHRSSRSATPHQSTRTGDTIHPDFEDIQAAHKAHIDAVMRGCFLDPIMMRLVGKTIQQVLELCQSFCGMVDRALSEGLDDFERGGTGRGAGMMAELIEGMAQVKQVTES
ncbi:gamma-tubulin complex component protein [Fimicolochytrium jonesii]|uniref:gamma-tubulin complex component protein n=1 Tax=Fimicolochytrium jonesii TaxID=1396493 RepID=UPI0022FE4C6D|nr:gamma-tubulin complex component protein [Fimicolochytrium jonesii]KAI8825899.1 gamma-tubulin complex component protein [Fimicolochytrium jonesii]